MWTSGWVKRPTQLASFRKRCEIISPNVTVDTEERRSTNDR